MIVAPGFVFLHLHKSGGTFVNECLLRFVPGSRQVGYHLPRSALPPESADLPVLGFVRNPWSYYVSWYAFQSVRAQPNPLFQVLSDGGRLGFAGTIGNMLSLGGNGELLDAAVAALPDRYTNRGINLPGFALAAIRNSGLGFYTFLYRHMFGSGRRLQIGRMESLRSDLPAMLEAVGAPVGDDLLRHLRDAAPSNVSAHRDYADYYDAALRDLVAARDAPLVERYRYRFGA